ncbi:glutamine--fructose-6-phosphate transaminase (isomerizing) [Humisphaera borealis]|uniref:Glutamine--fructose-6-phosphate aminotransferase [isomerizing] n=1 Tax=Humisphaera borealis TaxID=2807512 RepID=A0A7M2WR88_9BACT|nr:glutamine--fructose-6-phosphate transaminase (isomerizing) [Humisphaera borealis]QOV88057.1 glutamine--fructose-6-phosphate transaminase (isomerizing) [Humisphaera borealis]
MCGIIAYVGQKNVQPLLIEGLKRLEYRGYDSSGLAVIDARRQMHLRRAVGRISVLEDRLAEGSPLPEANIGLAHTRWATHGPPTEANAHPHVDAAGRIALVHNGIIENYVAIKQLLVEKGYTFKSQTDTEVLAQLIGDLCIQIKEQNHLPPGASILQRAVQAALNEVEGTYGIAVVSSDEPQTLVVARKGSPLIIGVGDDEYVVASDASAIIEHTTQVVHLNDHEMAVLRAGPGRETSFRTMTIGDITVSPVVQQLENKLEEYELGDYEHYMLKEIFEQPNALRNCLRGRAEQREGRIVLGGLADHARDLVKARRFILTGQGTAWHAALVGDYLMEDLAKVVTEATYASEFRYRNPIVEEGTVVVAISQSGETADTLAALREAKERGAMALGLINVVGSTIARETDAGIYLHAGPEIGVASTKAFTCQLAALTMLSVYVGRKKFMGQGQTQEVIDALCAVPDQLDVVLKTSEQVRDIAAKFVDRENWLFLGRGYHYPVALEGALKLKEISYIHAEGMPAAEIKHGPIALINDGMPVVFIATQGLQYDKVISNIEVVRARGGKIIAVATEGDTNIGRYSDDVIYIPHTIEPIQPLLSVVPLQLMAYHAAVLRGCNVDKPRNLAKSVTVE